MGERKVINFYHPADFDPSAIPMGKKGGKKEPKSAKMSEIRMMLPFTVWCSSCGEYMGVGSKFNANKEEIKEENYLGIAVFRMIMKCKGCKALFSIKTDPKNSFYEIDTNCSRMYVPWADDRKREDIVAERAAEEAGDAMRALENKTAENRIEMDINDSLGEQLSLNRRQANVDVEAMLKARQAEAEAAHAAALALSRDEEAIVQAAFSSNSVIRRLPREGPAATGPAAATGGVAAGKAPATANARPQIQVRARAKRPADDSDAADERPAKRQAVAVAAPVSVPAKASGGLVGYGGSDSSSD